MRNDKCIELTGERYERAEGESQWHSVDRDELLDLLDGDTPPAFRTILGKTGDLYSGPWYADIDADLDEACHSLNQLLDKLHKLGVNLNAVRIFATGGRGFHIEVPQGVFGGVDHSDLPKIYREMALGLYVDGLDLRVYSGGRGRMWRVPNVQRSNGLYKVPLTLAEAQSITPERYVDLCSEPRSFPELETPALATGLAQLYAQCRDRISASTKRVRTWTAAERELRQRFDGNCPPSVHAVLKGEFLPEAGWNKICIQLALLAHVLGWSDDRLVHEARGLIERHASDGHRYNTPRKRERELLRMYAYTENNPDYSFSVGGLCSILPPGYKPDLQALEADSDDEINYAQMIDTCEDTRAVVDLARQINRDDALTETETAALLKRCARAAGVGVKTLQADLHNPGTGLVITVAPSDFSGSVDSAMRVLPHIPSLRQRSGELVEVRGNRICRVDVSKLAYVISSVAKWRNPEGGASKPDVQILNAVVGFGEWPGVPELMGVAGQPSLLLDGTVGIPPGYEAAFNPVDFPEYEGSPADALAELCALISEFPFATKQDESAALAAILTAVARPILRTSPGFLISAHDLGTGKSYLAELIALFAAPTVEMLRWAQRAEEQDKMLLSLLMEGRPVCVFDNLMKDWKSPTLAAILTSEVYTDRVLGASEARQVSTKTLFISTGNNIKAGADLSRRVIPIELDAGRENPLSRRFASDPVAQVRADRGRWVMLALRVLQGFVQSGATPDLPPLASFMDWSKLIRGALVSNDMPDVVESVIQSVETDDDREMLGLVLDEWVSTFGVEALTLRDAWLHVRGIQSHGLRLLLLERFGRGDDIDLLRAGQWLGSQTGRVVAGVRLVRERKGKRGVPWRVESV